MSKSYDKLIQEKNWLVRKSGRDIALSKMVGSKAVTLRLVKQAARGKYHIEFPSYLFTSKISHFAPFEEEVRFCRNKAMLFSLVKTLKRSYAWKMISNKNFMVINGENGRSDKRTLKKQLRELTGIKSPAKT